MIALPDPERGIPLCIGSKEKHRRYHGRMPSQQKGSIDKIRYMGEEGARPELTKLRFQRGLEEGLQKGMEA